MKKKSYVIIAILVSLLLFTVLYGSNLSIVGGGEEIPQQCVGADLTTDDFCRNYIEGVMSDISIERLPK